MTMGSGSVTYVDNMACRLARLLATQADRLTASSHQTLLTPFALTVGALPALDEELVQALTHLELPPGWTVLGHSSLKGESSPENVHVSSLCQVQNMSYNLLSVFLPTCDPNLDLMAGFPEVLSHSSLGWLILPCSRRWRALPQEERLFFVGGL